MFLLLAIFFASMLFVTFKFFDRYAINNFQGIVFNYWSAAFLSLLIGFEQNISNMQEVPGVIFRVFIIGFLFIMVFHITALTTQKLGLAIASVAAKMSVVIPITAGVLLYNEKLSTGNVIGIIVALAAVYFTSSRKNENQKQSIGLREVLLPFLLFAGTGLVDSSIKYAQHTFMTDDNRNIVSMCLFGSAGTFGLFKLVYNMVALKEKIELKNIAGGICLGSFNYLSLYFLLKCLEFPGAKSALVFSLLNIGVVLFSSLTAVFFFKEKLSGKNMAGILLAIIATVLLME